ERIPTGLQQDANFLETDESYHAGAEVVVLNQAAEMLNMPRNNLSVKDLSYLDTYFHEIRTANPQDAQLLEIFTAIIIEMCFSKTLCVLPKDPTVNSGVIKLIKAHAMDERRHYVYHRSLLLVL